MVSELEYGVRMNSNNLRFIDLFAGLGGFHLALEQLGHNCVFASELQPDLRELYSKNFGIEPAGDIRNVALSDIPEHDVLCAGFPCQPFSKAGDQLGTNCPKWGDLFSHVLSIIGHHRPNYFILENVPNLLRHDKGRTWAEMEQALRSHGYSDVHAKILSPHMFGVPQARERAIIIGSMEPLRQFDWPGASVNRDDLSIRSILEPHAASAKRLNARFIEYLNAWQELLNTLPSEVAIPSFPIWAMEFGATYPFENETPHALGFKIQEYKGAFGRELSGLTPDEMRLSIPTYAALEQVEFPAWKKNFIRQNRKFYTDNNKVIDKWLPKILDFAPSFQKLEWNWKDGGRNIWNTVIQFRASGIRVKRPTVSPSLVALTTSQLPVIAWERRFMSVRECARLQSMDHLQFLPNHNSAAFKAFGNAVNVKVINQVARRLLSVQPNLVSDLDDIEVETDKNGEPVMAFVS
ncbi:DNA cytosine methyltransferase [Brucella sp. MAB-22]|uniref:DNA cytosine methyltransferase n=1 Tax=Brucella sp. MAB-22 TaxID=2986424 RepID=UPI0022206FD2|nr:DNA cytosine methyltransferase [Brucella sp. MAB-22]UYT55536.1 DNA cytosine methyltransferase [Brucella sp. MAB-22]